MTANEIREAINHTGGHIPSFDSIRLCNLRATAFEVTQQVRPQSEILGELDQECIAYLRARGYECQKIPEPRRFQCEFCGGTGNPI